MSAKDGAEKIGDVVDAAAVLESSTSATTVETPKSEAAAEARKRRREIISSQRKVASDASSSNALVVAALEDHVVEAALNAASEMADQAEQAVEASKPQALEGSSNVAEEMPLKPLETTPETAATTEPPPATTMATTTEPDVNEATAKRPAAEQLHSDDASESSKRKKTQVRYEPAVPMNKDQLAAWRREARRVRNRQSAAASRMKTKERIQELEGQVGDWKQKYTDAMRRLDQLEAAQQRASST